MKLSENTTDTCINMGFFPGRIPEIFVFGNDLKVDVRTGNLVTDGHFMTDDELSLNNKIEKGDYIRDGSLEYFEKKIAVNGSLEGEELKQYIDMVNELALWESSGSGEGAWLGENDNESYIRNENGKFEMKNVTTTSGYNESMRDKYIDLNSDSVGRNQRNNLALTQGANADNMCNPTSFSSALHELGIDEKDGQDVIKNIIGESSEAKKKLETIMGKRGLTINDIGKINQLEDALDIIVAIQDYDGSMQGDRTNHVAVLKAIQKFNQIDNMTPIYKGGNKDSNIVDFQYDDGTSVLNKATYSQKDLKDVYFNEGENASLQLNFSKNENDAKEYYNKLSDQLDYNERAILGTMLTHNGHMVQYAGKSDYGIFVNDPYGELSRTANTYKRNTLNNETTNGNRSFYSWNEVYRHSIGITTPHASQQNKYPSTIRIRREKSLYERLFK